MENGEVIMIDFLHNFRHVMATTRVLKVWNN